MKTLKRSLAALLALCVLAGVLAATAFAEGSYRVSGQFFTLNRPADWEGKVLTEEYPENPRYTFRVFHRASRESEGAGVLFALQCWEDFDFVVMPHYMVAGVLSDGEKCWYLVAGLPSDVQAAIAYMDEYFSLYNEETFREIFDTLEPAEGLTYEPMDPALLERMQLRAEYGNALHLAIGFNELPDGTPILPEGWDGDMANNRFAVWDVDGDGQEELLISVEDSYMAGMCTVIYRGDDYPLAEELRAFPVPEFFEGGLARSYASHNQTWGMSCWPYSLWRFDGETKLYTELASVYSWDRELSETDFDGTPFPAAADRDGNGTVYSITDENGQRWVDDADYFAWEDELLGGAAPMEIPWMALTSENVETLIGG